jgi:ATP/maltotriose-dependent transcriptional regulator MalT
VQEAVKHALLHPDLNQAAQLIDRHALELLYQGEVQTVLDWFASLPESVMRSRPMIWISKAWALAVTWREDVHEEVENLLQKAESCLIESKAADNLVKMVRGHAASIQAILIQSPVARGHDPQKLITLALESLVHEATGEKDRALVPLKNAVIHAAQGGFVRIFVDEGPPIARLLYEAVTRGIVPDYARRLLAAFPVAEPERADPAETQALNSGLVEPLSERELEVLELIAKGLTNPEIASRLFLTLNTVKTHARNIYGKLGVHNRTQAVARSQELGLLPRSRV